ncbi:hypothetical protein CLV72_107312 [Allonocardiopsis opalescens]|uniref:DUF3040 family protein n=1 Tax=Allonocardiopsis opalescens TaxID=1144618 RepID=A0A2T0PZC6_9ACTN|nr:hypothetical protein CLV72_107312 [Allonocardiopsis opalescens]
MTMSPDQWRAFREIERRFHDAGPTERPATGPARAYVPPGPVEPVPRGALTAICAVFAFCAVLLAAVVPLCAAGGSPTVPRPAEVTERNTR